MKHPVYLRPLVLEDAETSYQWRNDPEIWEFTGSRPDRHITHEIEKQWLSNTLERRSERRFAICLKSNDRYIGNIQLIDIQNGNACFHIFIGEKRYWGKGIGKEATSLILKHAFSEMNLASISLEVHKNNLAARSVYCKMGFVDEGIQGEFQVMKLTRNNFSGLSTPDLCSFGI